MKLIGIIIAVLMILAAIYNFDWHFFNSWLISALLLLGAALTLVQEGKLNKFIRRTAFLLAIFLILKLLLFG